MLKEVTTDSKDDPTTEARDEKISLLRDGIFDLFADEDADVLFYERFEKILTKRVFSPKGAQTFTKRQIELMLYLLERKNRGFWKSNGYAAIIVKETLNTDELDRLIKVALAHRLQTTEKELISKFPTSRCRKISMQERNLLNLHSVNLEYNEIGFPALCEIFYNMIPRLPQGGTFYDLGCGAGKVVVAAALLHRFDTVVGIELLPNLVTTSKELVRGIQNSETKDSVMELLQRMKLTIRAADFTKVDWSDGDVVFANSSSFDDILFKTMVAMAEKLKVGAYVITTTFALNSTKFALLTSRQFDTESGQRTFHVHRRCPKGGCDKVVGSEERTDYTNSEDKKGRGNER